MLGILFPGISAAQQFDKRLDSLCVLCDNSSSDSQKIIALGNIADHFYIYKLNAKGDSVLHEQLLIAELSDNKKLILKVLFGDAILNISPSSSSESFDKTISFIKKGIEYARLNNDYDYLVLGYIRMSEILRKRGNNDRAFFNCTAALSLLQNVSSDSVKAVAYIEFGETSLARGEAVLACTNFNNAFDIAVKIRSAALQSKVYHCLSEMYRSLDDFESAKSELRNSISLNKESAAANRLLLDYLDLARLTDEKYFIRRSIELADSLHDYKNLLTAKRLLLVYTYVIEKNAAAAFSYMKSEPDLKQSYLNDGLGNYYVTLGNIFFYSGYSDSALHYYQLAEPQLVRDFEKNLTRVNFEQIAECYKTLGNKERAILYYRKALEISRQLNDIYSIAFYSGNLSYLFEQQKDFQHALQYSRQSDEVKDSISGLSKQKDIAHMGVVRENKKHEQVLMDQRTRETNNRNIQYFGITLTLLIVFFIMLFVGSFPVSPLTVRLMGFFFFISLFEFIVLIIDNLVLFRPFHNAPFKLWMVKIGLIALLAPFQHFMENGIIRLLVSRKLIAARTNFSPGVWWKSLKQRLSQIKQIEEDEAVL